MRIKPFVFKLVDTWLGFFFQPEKNRFYFLPLPWFGIRVDFQHESGAAWPKDSIPPESGAFTLMSASFETEFALWQRSIHGKISYLLCNTREGYILNIFEDLDMALDSYFGCCNEILKISIAHNLNITMTELKRRLSELERAKGSLGKPCLGESCIPTNYRCEPGQGESDG